MTFLSCFAALFGALFCAKAVWLFYLLVIKRERIDDMSGPVSGWGTPELGPMERSGIYDAGCRNSVIAGGVGVEPIGAPSRYPQQIH